MELRGLAMSTLMVLSLITGLSAHPNFFIVAPNIMRVDEPTTVQIFADSLNDSRTIRVSIHNTVDHQVHSTATTSLNGTQKSYVAHEVELFVDSAKLGTATDGEGTYVRLTAHCLKGAFRHSALILVDRQTGMVFLQTDKPVYSPRQTVHLRIFTLNEQRKAHNVPVRIDIKNPDEVILMQQNVSSEMGISSVQFKVPDPAIYGDWSAVVYHGHRFSQNKTIVFKVKEYVLPHFKVQILQANNVITSKTVTLKCLVKARHSFDAPVVGEAQVTFWVRKGREEIRATSPDKAALQNGETEFEVSLSEITDFLNTSVATMIENEDKLRIEAEVTETSSGVREMADVTSLDFANSPYVISTEWIPWSFSKNMIFYFQIQVSLRDGSPAIGVMVNVKVISGDQSTAIITPSSTDNTGMAYFSHGIGSGVKNIEILAHTTNTAGEGTTKKHRVKCSTMEHQMIIVRSVQPLTPAGHPQIIVRRSVNTSQKLHYVLVSGGRTLHFGQVVSLYQTTRITVKITHQMVPRVRVLVWYVTGKGSMVSASQTFHVRRTCEREISLTQDLYMDQRHPGTNISLKVRGPELGTVALLAVDKAVYFLSTQNLLTRSQMFNNFDSMDVGCGDSGGQKAHQVFEFAGVAMVSAAVTTTSRPSRACAGWVNTPSTVRKRRHTSATRRSPRSADGHLNHTECCALGTSQASALSEVLGDDATIAQIDTLCRLFVRILIISETISCQESIFSCCAHKLFKAIYKRPLGNGRADSATNAHASFPPATRVIDLVDSRDDFPESFLIETVNLDIHGEATKAVHLPDSITTWSFMAVSMSTYYMMCVSRPHDQLVKMDVFLKLQLPYEAVLGEQLELRATVYNTGTKTQRTIVKLLETPELCTAAETRLSRAESIAPGASFPFRWLIIPRTTGQVLVSVMMSDPIDTVTRILNVIPAGLMKSTKPVYITLNPQCRGQRHARRYAHTEGTIHYKVHSNPKSKTQVSRIDLQLPPDAIQNTQKITLGLTGEMIADVVDAFMKETTHYLKGIASAYGEESMARLSSTVCAARYINQRIGGSLPNTTTEAIDQGVLVTMAFRTTNGAFGLLHGKWENIWLTAFTVRTLSAARPFSRYLKLQPGLICKAVSWLLKQKSTDGSYHDWRGIPTLYFLKDQPEERVALTAYVLIAMYDAGCAETNSGNLDGTVNYLVKKANTVIYHYTKAIIAYALAKGGHRDAPQVLDQLLNMATTVRGHVPTRKFWKNTSLHTTTQQDVETAAYGVLTMIELERTSEASPYVVWLMSERKANGLFPNPQTTVLGLHALTDYSLNTPNSTIEMTCHIKAIRSQPPINDWWTISSRHLSRQFVVSRAAGQELTVRCRGQGQGRLSITSSYYSDTDTMSNQSSAFHINVTTFDVCHHVLKCTMVKTVNEFSIKVCIRAIGVDVGRSVIDVGITTGYQPTKSLNRVKRTNKQVEQFTSTERSVIFHVPKITTNNALCIQFNVRQFHKVNDIQPVPIKVQDYYNPELVGAKFYKHISTKNEIDLCPKCYGYSRNLLRPTSSTFNELHRKACSCFYDYVFEVRLENYNQDGDVRKANFTITAVAKEGFEGQAVLNMVRTFIFPPNCQYCHNLELTRKYFIMGKEVPQIAKGRRLYYVKADTYIVQKGGNRPAFNPEQTAWKAHKDILREPDICSHVNASRSG